MNGSKTPEGVTQPLDNPPAKTGTATQEPGSTDNSVSSLESQNKIIEELRIEMKKLSEQNKEQRSEIGRLGDELGTARNQVQTTADIKEVAERFQSTLLDSNDPESAFRAMISLISEAFGERDKMERETLDTYKKVTKRNPDLSKVPFGDFRNEAIYDGVFNEVRSGNAMERYINNMLAAHNTPESIKAKIDEAKRQGAEEERKKLEVAGLIPKSGGGSPPETKSDDDDGIVNVLFEQKYGKRPL